MTRAPYYEDDAVTLYEGRCEDILPTLNPTGSVHLLTDPPYFQVKDDDWDNQWTKAAHFLDWMGEWLDLAKPHLTPDASVWVFASPELTGQVEELIAERFHVLNSVRWVKPTGDASRRNDITALRRFLSHWEGIVFAEQPDDAFDTRDLAEHRRVFAPLGDYIRAERERAGYDQSSFAVALGFTLKADPTRGTVLPLQWERGSSLPTRTTYENMRRLAGPGFFARPYDDLRDEYEALGKAHRAGRVAYEHLRRPFTLRHRARSTDVWTFDNVPGYVGKHPCEKPLGLLAHMIETSTRPGDLILDPFSGSGAILDAARKAGRRAIGIEMDPKWCRRAAQRLGQQVLDFGDWNEEETA